MVHHLPVVASLDHSMNDKDDKTTTQHGDGRSSTATAVDETRR